MTSNPFKIALFADQVVGEQSLRYLLTQHRSDLCFIVVQEQNPWIKSLADQFQIAKEHIFTSKQLEDKGVQQRFRAEQISFFILAWWPTIIKQPWLSIPHSGIINFHPSLLPFNRGKHYNFWTLVEDTPFGVSLHFVDESVDGGDIIFQKQIPKTWEDTGESLYRKAQTAMFELFTESYAQIRVGKFSRTKQKAAEGSIHYAKELEVASKIELTKNYSAKELLNLIRAKTFPPHPGAWFEDDGNIYEVTVNIRKRQSDVK